MSGLSGMSVSGASRATVAVVIAVTAVLSSVVGVTEAPAAIAAPPPASPPDQVISSPGGVPSAHGSTGRTGRSERISPRLQRWSQPSVQALASADRSRALSVVESGPGSLTNRPGGRVLTEARVTDTAAATLSALTATGARVVSVSSTQPVVTLEVAPAELTALAALPAVRYVDEVLQPEVRGGALASASPAGPATSGLTAAATGCGTRLIDEADQQLRAATARSTYGVDGTGVQVGLLSDSYDRLGGAADDIRAGELPGDENPCGHTVPVRVQSEGPPDLLDPTDEGRAMAQAVHDLAPGAPLSFATAMNGESDFADQVRQLQAGGASVIADDIYYPSEPMYQDGVIAKAITDVTAAGATYLSAAGNDNGIVGAGNIASYEATGGYRPTPCPALVDPGTDDCHDFNPSFGVDNGDGITLAGGATLTAALGWNEPQLGIVTDLDLYLYDLSTGSPVAASLTTNLASQKAFEFLSFTNPYGTSHTYRLVVGRWEGVGTPRFKIILHRPGGVIGVQWQSSQGGDVIGPTLTGHAASAAAGAVGAVPYTDATTVEPYSSRGPSTRCYGPVSGSVAAAPLPSCQTKQLDFVATDGGRNTVLGWILGDGVRHFYGTSQSSPHAAAIAAIQRQAHPCRTPAQVLAAQRASGRTVGFHGVDAAGSGLIDAVTSVSGLAPCPMAPGAPRDVRAGAVASKTISVTWTVPVADIAYPVTSYTVTASPGGATCVWTGGPLSCTIGGLVNGASYSVSVRATNSLGSGPVGTFGPVVPFDRKPFGASSGAGAPVAVGTSPDGRLELFAVDPNGGLIHAWQLSPNGTWSDWHWMGASVRGAPAVTTSADGRLELFAVDPNGGLIHAWQLSPNGTWSGWQWTGAIVAGVPSTGIAPDGRIELFAADAAGGLIHAWQLAPNGTWSGWQWMGVRVQGPPSVAASADGRLELFAADTAGGLIHAWQLKPNGVWSDFRWRGVYVHGAPTAGIAPDGRIELFAADPAGALIHTWQLVPNGVWSGWQAMGAQVSGAPSVAASADGRLELFGVGPSGALIQSWQLTPNGVWSGWVARGADVRGAPTLGVAPDHRLELFAADAAGGVVQTWQLWPNGTWSGWRWMGVFVR